MQLGCADRCPEVTLKFLLILLSEKMQNTHPFRKDVMGNLTYLLARNTRFQIKLLNLTYFIQKSMWKVCKSKEILNGF